MKNKIRCTLLLLLLVQGTLHAQLGTAIRDILASDTTAQQAPSTASIDSLRTATLQQQLADARLNEQNMRMEMEEIKLASLSMDSVKRKQQLLRIDSLRASTVGIPVVVEADTLYYLYTKRGGHSPKDRAQTTAAIIMELGKRYGLSPDSVFLEITDIVTDIMYEDKVIASFTDQDGLWANTTKDQLAENTRLIIVQKLKELKDEYGLFQLGKRIFYFILVLVVQFILFRGTTWVYRRLRVRIMRLKETKLKPVSFRDYELFDTQRQVKLLLFGTRVGRYILVLLQLIITVPILFSIFPQTEDLALQIFSYIWNPVKSIFLAIIAYIPDMFTIIIIWYAIKYVVKGVGYLAGEIESEKLKITGFYPDWAQPTFHIIRFLLYAFMIAMIYPYLPGAQSGAFQGISVFVGLVVSLGSSTVIGNIMAGMVITYMRPFKMGDRIKLNDTMGNVIEKTPFVTRLRTPKNEVVTIPNSFIMSSHTVNYSASARNYGLIIHSEVSFGYETPWRRVHPLLIEAALATPGVMPEPSPFILETSLHDWYPIYQVNAYIQDADKLAQIYSDLHQNIQDVFNREKIEILSAHYMAMRDGNTITTPKDDLSGNKPKAE